MRRKRRAKTAPNQTRLIRQLLITGLRQCSHSGQLIAGGVSMPCAIGRRGLTHHKREGDGATPAGDFHILQGFFRPDRVSRMTGNFPLQAIRPSDGWCDDPASGMYNCRVKLPFRPSHEALSRQDHLYDIVFTLDHNQRPRVRGLGSAIFFHLAHADMAGTAGCIAIRLSDMRRLLPRLCKGCRLRTG